jgi:hypothetical protein
VAKAKVVHSDDAVLIEFKGNKSNPEPSTAVIRFPGGEVEVARCSDGTYWVHTFAVSEKNIVGSRVDYCHEANHGVGSIPDAHLVNKMSLRIANTVNHFDPNA